MTSTKGHGATKRMSVWVFWADSDIKTGACRAPEMPGEKRAQGPKRKASPTRRGVAREQQRTATSKNRSDQWHEHVNAGRDVRQAAQ